MLPLPRSALLVLFLSFLPCLSAAAGLESQPKLSLLPPIAAVAVEPQVAPLGTPRKIVVAGTWPDACIPTNARLALPPSVATTQGIGILLDMPLSFVACATTLTRYRFELDFTPTQAGQVEILVMTSRASPLATGTLVTGDAQSPKALYDATGAWFDPATAGSGLVLTHDYGQTDQVFATWSVYDPATGAPRWYWVEQGFWEADGRVWKGTLFESTADPSTCTAPCASPLSHVAFRGVVRLAFSVSVASGGLEATMDLVSGDGSLRRLSNLQRFLPRRIVIQ